MTTISADEIIEDGMHFDETLKLMKILKDHGVDMFNVSAGLHSEGMMKYMRYWLQGYTMERGYNAHWTKKAKDYFQGDIRLTAVGSITNVDLAEYYLSEGWCDFIAMCRPLMADPDMPKKPQQGRGYSPAYAATPAPSRRSQTQSTNLRIRLSRDGRSRARTSCCLGAGPPSYRHAHTLIDADDVTVRKTDHGGCVVVLQLLSLT